MKKICCANLGLKCDYRRRQDREGFNECIYAGECNQQKPGSERVKEIADKLEVDLKGVL